MQSPDLLLLDEPTNHLDLEGIIWLEKFLPKEAPSYLLVSHDRFFLQNMINRTIEINPVYPGGLFAIDGTYEKFLELKESFLKGQSSRNAPSPQKRAENSTGCADLPKREHPSQNLGSKTLMNF